MEPRRDDRTEEVEIRPAYVAWIVRITEKGRLREYRKVTHRYDDGCNGSAMEPVAVNRCTEHWSPNEQPVALETFDTGVYAGEKIVHPYRPWASVTM
ncbi:MAG: hypothetical protein IPH05_14325 [Flavobacteriales bacterium]|nr:hypothetical protein [Flavobacteriales bacterium]